MRFTFLIGVILICLLLVQCKTVQNAHSVEELESAIQGRWNIEYVECCGRTSAITYGGTQSIRFKPKKQAYVLSNNHVKSKGSYKLSSEKIGTLIYIGDRSPAILRITDGRLFIDWSYMDLKREVYGR